MILLHSDIPSCLPIPIEENQLESLVTIRSYSKHRMSVTNVSVCTYGIT